MKKYQIFVFGGLGVLVLAGALFYSNNGFEQKSIPIGAIVARTGKSAPYGEMMERGAIIAIDEANQKAGFQKFKLKIQDSQSDNKTALSAYEYLKNSGAKVFIGGQSSIILALAPKVDADHLILLNTTALSPDIRHSGEYVFSNINDATVEVSEMAQFIKKSGSNRVAVIYENDDAAKGAKMVFEKSFADVGGSTVAEASVTPPVTDARTELLKIKALHPDAIYLLAFPQNAGVILKQAQELNIKTAWFSWNIEGTQIIDIAGDAAEGLIYTSTSFDTASIDERIAVFVRKFKEKYGVEPNIYAATSYDGVTLLSEAVNAVGNSADKIKSHLSRVLNWPGVSGTTTFDQDGAVKKPVQIKIIKNQKFVRY